MAENPATPMPDALTDFQRAAAAARAEAGARGWCEMSPSEQTRAIYAQLRLIDEARATALTQPRRLPGDGRAVRRTAST